MVLMGAKRKWENNSVDKLGELSKFKFKKNLGFKDLKIFNMVSLVKQEWMLQNEESLLHKLKKLSTFQVQIYLS